ncbi:hypothetical protein BDR22DRAFT_821681 [Usnea florida]
MNSAAAKSYASTAPLTPVAPKPKPAATAVAHVESIPDSSLTEDETVAVAAKAHDSCDFASIVSMDLGSSSTVRRALVLITQEVGLEVSDVNDDAAFVNSGVGSLVSLAIMTQIYDKFGVKTGGSLIIKYPIL